MKKLKEIGILITESVSALVWLLTAVSIPYFMVQLILRVLSDEGVYQMPIAQQFIYLILILWMVDLLVRPIIVKILNMNIDRVIKVFAWTPFKKGREEKVDARYPTTTKADA